MTMETSKSSLENIRKNTGKCWTILENRWFIYVYFSIFAFRPFSRRARRDTCPPLGRIYKPPMGKAERSAELGIAFWANRTSTKKADWKIINLWSIHVYTGSSDWLDNVRSKLVLQSVGIPVVKCTFTSET